jgi:hypothetical protein
VKAGSGWSSFDGNVDALSVGIDGAETIFDFEGGAGRQGRMQTRRMGSSAARRRCSRCTACASTG